MPDLVHLDKFPGGSTGNRSLAFLVKYDMLIILSMKRLKYTYNNVNNNNNNNEIMVVNLTNTDFLDFWRK